MNMDTGLLIACGVLLIVGFTFVARAYYMGKMAKRPR